MKEIHLRIITLEKVVFDGPVNSITLPAEAGEIGVLPDHAPLITPLVLGEITARKNGEVFYMAVSSGMAEIQPNRAIILADQAERAEEIDEKLAEEARKKAEDIMREKRTNAEEFAMAEAELQQAILRLKVAKKHRSKKGILPPSV